jgi:hypothetical protein
VKLLWRDLTLLCREVQIWDGWICRAVKERAFTLVQSEEGMPTLENLSSGTASEAHHKQLYYQFFGGMNCRHDHWFWEIFDDWLKWIGMSIPDCSQSWGWAVLKSKKYQELHWSKSKFGGMRYWPVDLWGMFIGILLQNAFKLVFTVSFRGPIFWKPDALLYYSRAIGILWIHMATHWPLVTGIHRAQAWQLHREKKISHAAILL